MLKTSLLGAPGAIWWPRHENIKNEPSVALMWLFGGQGTEMLKMNPLGASWGHVAAKTQTCSK